MAISDWRVNHSAPDTSELVVLLLALVLALWAGSKLIAPLLAILVIHAVDHLLAAEQAPLRPVDNSLDKQRANGR